VYVVQKHPLIRKNDKVVVLTGKEKGKIGTVLKVDSEKGRAVVEKINMVKRHTRPGGKQAQGGAFAHFQSHDPVRQVCGTDENRKAGFGRRFQGKDLQEVRGTAGQLTWERHTPTFVIVFMKMGI
jgi:ribosomal protein L24